MADFIESVGGTWEFIKGCFYIALILFFLPMLIPIIRDVFRNERPLD